MTFKLRLIVLILIIHPLFFAGYLFSEDFTESEYDLADFYGDEDFVSIATGTKKAITKAPAVASVITAADIKNIGARNLAEVLEIVPGLHVSKSGQNFTPEFWFRGITSTFNPQTLIMINGVSTKSVVRGDNHTVWGEFPVHGIERIEIIRGPGSALYGADAFSGVINIITKQGGDNFENEVGGMLGSFNTTNFWVNNQVEIADWKIAVNVEFLKSDGQKEIVQADTQTIIDAAASGLGVPAASLAPGHLSTGFESIDLWMSAENTLLGLQIGTQRRSNVGTGQGGTEALDNFGRLGNYKNIIKAFIKNREILSNLFVEGSLTYYGSSQEIEKNMVLFPPGSFFGTFPEGFIGNPGWEEEKTNFQLSARYKKFQNTDFSFGVGYDRQNLYKVVETKNFYADFSPRLTGIEDVSDTSEVYMPEADRESSYAYIQVIRQLAPDWELTAGARYDNYTDFGATLNPRIALVWSSSLNLTTKLLYGKAFRAPAFAESLVVNNPIALGNSDLDPETIDTFELAFNYNYSEDTSIDFNVFNYEIDDFITFVPDQDGVTAKAQNVGKRSGRGLETSIEYKAIKDFKLVANAAYVKAEDKLVNENVGEYPNLQFYVRGEWSINSDWQLNSQLIHIGKRDRVPGDQREKLDGYTQLNISTAYSIPKKNIRIELLASNLLDEDIREPSSAGMTMGVVNIPDDLPQAGRAVYLRISTTY
ncbi:TonB-dependent receptor plug domain-containing protein [Aliikangiella sp. IMCC44359]|uniref:TonB-dependent receptor plug domain-containing protein n=1 Tax=Aliikangiella sp. IMCC44359 TaxID=3459125 RepID=UPI00403ACDB6